MKTRLVVICGGLILSAGMLVAARQVKDPVKDDDKAPVVESGYITKINLKNNVLTVRGYVGSLPAEPPAAKPGDQGAAGRSGGNPGGRRSGGSPAAEPCAGRASGSNARRGPNVPVGGSSPTPLRDFKVYVRADTAIQEGKTVLGLKELKIDDFVMVVGVPKGNAIDLDAASISVSFR
jgi:hypothetical protein